MKIKLWSDIHLEFTDSSVPIERDGADVLILGGDICTTRNIEDYLPFFEKCAATFPHVIYIAGNHEHYGNRIDGATGSVNRMSVELRHLKNLFVLDGDAVEIDGTYFWGGTLWTDCNKGDPLTLQEMRGGMNDYRRIQNGARKLTPEDTIEEHCVYRRKLESFLADVNDGKPCVVVTHHAPSKLSLHPRYQTDYHFNGGYSSDLSELMLRHPEIKLWTHGHTHDSFDYKVGETRIVANPAGYPLSAFGRRSEGRENPKFDPALVLDIDLTQPEPQAEPAPSSGQSD